MRVGTIERCSEKKNWQGRMLLPVLLSSGNERVLSPQ